MGDHVLLDASKRFALKREASNFDAGTNELSFIQDTMVSQTGQYIKAVEKYSPEVSSALSSVLSEGVRVGVSTADPGLSIDENILPNPDFGVVYVKGESRQLNPRFYLSLGMISLMRKQFDPLLEGIEGDDSAAEIQLESAAVAGSWFTLGKWSIDTIDPRYVEDPDTNVAAIKALYVFTGQDVSDSDRLDQEAIGDSLAVLSYRMAGAMAYKGLANYLKSKGMQKKVDSLEVFQKMQSAYYDLQFSEESSKRNITPVGFSLAKPLLAKEVARVFELLGPVADDLTSQNQLPKLMD